MIKTINSMLAVLILFGIGAVITCSQAADKRAQAEADCSRLARDKTGYNPSSQSSSSNIAKGAAIGAAGGAAGGALTANKKTSKKAAQGAVIGAAAGAGVAAISDNEKKKSAAQSSDAYQREYQNCLKDKGF